MRLLLWITLAWLLPGCHLAEPSFEAPQKLFNTEWLLIELQGEPVPVTAQSSMQLSSGGQVTGNGGVHRFSARLQLGPNGALNFTRPSCVQQIGPNWGWSHQERYLSFLEHSVRWWFYGPYLVIADAWNRPHLVFLPAE